MTLGTGRHGPLYMVVDSANLYWTEQLGGNLMWLPLGGGVLGTLASGQSRPQGIAADSKSVYWTDTAGGTVMKVAKP